MSIEIELVLPNNASNPISLEQAIRTNNERIVEAFEKAFSRFDDDTNNFLFTDLDMNGRALLNVGESAFLTLGNLERLEVGQLRVNPETLALEYMRPGSSTYDVLFELEQIRSSLTQETLSNS